MRNEKIDFVNEHTTCEILLTNVCNFICDYCIAKDLPGPPMTKEIGYKAIDLFIYLSKGAKTIDFIFTGGEPLLEFELLQDLTNYVKKHSIKYNILANIILKTNGSILNHNILNYLKKNSVKTIISIDGGKKIHDNHRKTFKGKSTYNIISKNIKTILDNKISCSASLTVHPHASISVPDSVQNLLELGIESIDIGPAYGTVSWTEKNCRIFSQSFFKIANIIHHSICNHKTIEIGPLFKESEHINNTLDNVWGCHAGSTNLAFLSNGKITGCSALAMMIIDYPEFILGDVFEGLDQLAIDNMLNLAQANVESRPSCMKCHSAKNCSGGCLAINYSTTKEPFLPPQIYCNTISVIPEAWSKAWT